MQPDGSEAPSSVVDGRGLHRLRGWLRSDGYYHFLLALLLVLILLGPFANVAATRLLERLTLFSMAIGSCLAVGKQRWRLVLAVLMAMAFIGQGLRGLDANEMSTGTSVAGVVLFGFVIASLVHDLFGRTRVNMGTVSAAMCVYLMIGLFWTFVAALLVNLTPGAFEGLPARAEAIRASTFRDVYYYSMVTLTTVGYGDVTPVTQGAKTLAILNAVSGQIVIVVLVARLVGLQVARSMLVASDHQSAE